MKSYGTVLSGGKAPGFVLIVGESFPQVTTTHLLTMGKATAFVLTSCLT
jgi:hypothetical protein